MNKIKSWDDYEKDLFSKGKITKIEMMFEKLKMVTARLLYYFKKNRLFRH